MSLSVTLLSYHYEIRHTPHALEPLSTLLSDNWAEWIWPSFLQKLLWLLVRTPTHVWFYIASRSLLHIQMCPRRPCRKQQCSKRPTQLPYLVENFLLKAQGKLSENKLVVPQDPTLQRRWQMYSVRLPSSIVNSPAMFNFVNFNQQERSGQLLVGLRRV